MFKEKEDMKKIYQIPEIKVVNVQPTLMQDASINMYGKNATSAGMSREGGSFWDNDDYDED